MKHMREDENPMDLFRKEAREVAEAFNSLIRAPVGSEGLDQKIKQLMYIAMKAAKGDKMAQKSPRADGKKAGATREVVVGVILLTLTVSGIRGIVDCLPDAEKKFE
jgi:alkylhydroperoxidase/carboxymuconolactone decarboxylase family protein YurZ